MLVLGYSSLSETQIECAVSELRSMSDVARSG